MQKRISSIKKNTPERADDERVIAAADDVDVQSALAAFASSEAGQIMRKSLLDNVGASVSALATSWRTASHIELMALCARLEDRLAILRTFSHARGNLEAAEAALDELTS
jgi:hypothetical protein